MSPSYNLAVQPLACRSLIRGHDRAARKCEYLILGVRTEVSSLGRAHLRALRLRRKGFSALTGSDCQSGVTILAPFLRIHPFVSASSSGARSSFCFLTGERDEDSRLPFELSVGWSSEDLRMSLGIALDQHHKISTHLAGSNNNRLVSPRLLIS